ncbi:hypothetical protein [Virgibacillus alimentarius]|uniref:hypothetical protein n=1 Tax=Virgibacillus alimentarius TaxID=698769 RepID=UPI0004938D1C|nr:hypothetical protein [Virgibacillus alimentarius]
MIKKHKERSFPILPIVSFILFVIVRMYTLYKYKERLKRIRLIQMGGILLPFIAATGVATGLIMEETRITGEINYMWIRTIVSYLIILIVLVGTIIPMNRIIANLFKK